MVLTDPQMLTEPASGTPEKALLLPSSLPLYPGSPAQLLAPASPAPKDVMTTKVLPLIETAAEFSPN